MTAESECLFCRIAAGEMGTRIYEDDQVVAFEDINPQAPNHTLIVPREHLGSSRDLSADREALAGRLLTVAARLAADKKLDSYRLVINCGASAGQTVPHLHLHLLGGRSFHWPPG
jgi:histidine triad (HIT) family protein